MAERWCAARVALCALLFVLAPHPAHASDRPTRVVVEVEEAARELVDEALTRRLIRLELAELPIPPPYATPLRDPEPPVYVRISHKNPFLSVELWDRGMLHGERKVSLRGGSGLAARSIALVTAELAKRLAERRRAEARARGLREARARKRSMEKRGTPLFARLVPQATAEGAVIGNFDTWLVGPGMEAELRFDNHAQLSLFGRGMTGRFNGAGQQWLELGLSPGYALVWSRRSAAVVELFAAAASTSFAGATMVDDSTSSTTWNARAGVGLALEHRFGFDLEGHLGLRAASTLRHVNVVLDERQTRFGGLWLGLDVGVAFDTSPRR